MIRLALQCVFTTQGHEERIWTIALSRSRETIAANPATGIEESHVIVEREMVTGGADSALSVWVDATADEVDAARKLQQEHVLEEQELFNRMAMRDYGRTVELCIKYVVFGRGDSLLHYQSCNIPYCDLLPYCLHAIIPDSNIHLSIKPRIASVIIFSNVFN